MMSMDAMVKHMVGRFLTWKLPEHFSPDNGIRFTPPDPRYPWPVGTNLLDAIQAEAMVRHMLDGLPLAALAAVPVGEEVEKIATRLDHMHPRPEGGWKLVNPDGPVAASLLRSLSASLAAVTAERDAARAAIPEWQAGYPTGCYAEEWFIAVTRFGDRVVLRALPEEYTYDFKTADDTYIKADRIARWMQFPDTQFKTPSECLSASLAAVTAERDEAKHDASFMRAAHGEAAHMLKRATAELAEARDAMRIAQGNTDAAIDDYNAMKAERDEAIRQREQAVEALAAAVEFACAANRVIAGQDPEYAPDWRSTLAAIRKETDAKGGEHDR
jgi:hypothetical protein